MVRLTKAGMVRLTKAELMRRLYAERKARNCCTKCGHSLGESSAPVEKKKLSPVRRGRAAAVAVAATASQVSPVVVLKRCLYCGKSSDAVKFDSLGRCVDCRSQRRL